MKHSPILYLLLTLLFFNCNKEEGSVKTPDCITQKIAAIQKEEVRNPPAKVYRYTFEGKTVTSSHNTAAIFLVNCMMMNVT